LLFCLMQKMVHVIMFSLVVSERVIKKSISVFLQTEDGIRGIERTRGLGDMYKRHLPCLPGTPFRRVCIRTISPDVFPCRCKTRVFRVSCLKWLFIVNYACLYAVFYSQITTIFRISRYFFLPVYSHFCPNHILSYCILINAIWHKLQK